MARPCADGDENITRDNLANSINALDYESRRTDIFVGVDVFGRGCLGGGGFQCDQPLREIRNRGLSVAIFAPGWTYEIPDRVRDKIGSVEVQRRFFVREHTFWGLLEQFLNFHGPNLESCRDPHRVAEPQCSLRFQTCFSLGLGSGAGCGPVAPAPTWWWYNLRKMEFQPSLCVVANEGENNDVGVLGTVLCTGVGKEGTEAQDDNDDKAVNPPAPPLPGYTCHTSDDCSYKLNQSLKMFNCSNEKTTTVPIFILELALPTNQETLFLLTLKVSI